MRPGPSVGVQPPIAAIRTLPEGLLAVHEAVEAPVGPFLAEPTPTPRPVSPRCLLRAPKGRGSPTSPSTHTLPPQGAVCGCCGCSAAIRGGTVVAGKR